MLVCTLLLSFKCFILEAATSKSISAVIFVTRDPRSDGSSNDCAFPVSTEDDDRFVEYDGLISLEDLINDGNSNDCGFSLSTIVACGFVGRDFLTSGTDLAKLDFKREKLFLTTLFFFFRY